MKKLFSILLVLFAFTGNAQEGNFFWNYPTSTPEVNGDLGLYCGDSYAYITYIRTGGNYIKRVGVLYCTDCSGVLVVDDPLIQQVEWTENIEDLNGQYNLVTPIEMSEGSFYWIKQFIEYNDGIIYSQVSQQTAPSCTGSAPLVTTCSSASNITKNSADLCGLITNNGGSTIQDFGIAVSTNHNPTTGGVTFSGSGNPLYQFTVTASGLISNTTYYYRAYAINEFYTGYGSEYSFTTSRAQTVPELTTNTVTSIGNNTATSGGIITSDGNATIIEKGVCWAIYPNTPNYDSSKTNDGSGSTSFTSSITGLSPNTQYNVRAYARNMAIVNGFYVYATGYGQTETFTTTGGTTATVITNSITDITSNSATGGGNVTNTGGSVVSAKGIQWSLYSSFSTIAGSTYNGTGLGAFSSSITGLTCGNTYYVRAYATNSSGTAYGNQVSFTTQPTVLASGNKIQFPQSPPRHSPFQVLTGFTNSGCDLIERGVVWSTSPNPTIADNKYSGSTSEGDVLYEFPIAAGTYYFGGYATNNIGTSYYYYTFAITIFP